MLKGFATEKGTERFFASRKGWVHDQSRRVFDALHLSSIGIGSYLGEPDDKDDAAYEQALKRALERGVNVIDCAINYRCQRSERSFGKALAERVRAGEIQRDEVFICTKGGFVPFDGAYPDDAEAFIEQEYLGPGILKPDDLAQGCHALAPAYLEDQLEKSRRNLGVETIDVYYLHNPETQLEDFSRKEFLERLQQAFVWLESKVREGKIRYYGVATWNAFRIAPEEPSYLSLEEILVAARDAGGPQHHFRAVQLPINLAMPEAWIYSNQPYGASRVSLSAFIRNKNFFVAASAALLQSRLSRDLPASLNPHFPDLSQASQRALQFARSVPGVTTALVGMKQLAHVDENLEVLKSPPMSEEALIRLFSSPAEPRR